MSSRSLLNVRGQEHPVEMSMCATGTVEFRFSFADESKGSLCLKRVCFNLTECAGDVTFPQCALEVNYVPGQATPRFSN